MTMTEFIKKVNDFKGYRAEFSKENNRVFIFKEDEPFTIAKIFLERKAKYMLFTTDIPEKLFNLIADYSISDNRKEL
ncbi:hypothetical protein [uncultured Megamonas sp.]|uniref:hypothetical protein n=1 Tax=uncultured Megamonas sp. TaxID=286140 RepID=UPI00259B1EDF|nr:hypothetical protein [uncultured Megamonas sp.]